MLSCKSAILGKATTQSKTISQNTTAKTLTNAQTVNNNFGMSCKFSGDERSKLNIYMQYALVEIGYSCNDAKRVCKYVVAHCNDERMLNRIHNDLRREWDDYSKVYEDVKTILRKFAASQSKVAKKESKVRSFFGQHFMKKLYVDCKEQIIRIILKAQTR